MKRLAVHHHSVCSAAQVNSTERFDSSCSKAAAEIAAACIAE